MKKKIGLIGGVGPQATQKIYGDIIKYSIEKYGAKNNDDFPNVLIESLPIPDFISDTKDLSRAKEMLIKCVQNLERAGVTVFSIGSNTVHILLDELKKYTDKEFISMPEMTAKKCGKLGFKKVGILGSPTNKKYGLYSKELGKFGMEAIYPCEKDQVIIDKIIRHVMAGTDNVNERKEYIEILHSLLNIGSNAIILACTELPQAINYEALGIRL